MSNLSNDVSHKVALFFFLLFLYSTPSLAIEMDHMVVKERVLGLNTCIEKKYTPEVQKRINNLTKNRATSVMLGRVSIYFPMFENVLREKGMPDDLKYLAVLESGLSPHATSSVGAAGLWQFMKPTGRMQGLKINSVVDERRHPVKSTYAAADYLQYLYDKFGDWTLAIAAYNCGPGNVRKAIKRSGGKKTYWEIHKYLPKQTRHYVPKYLAYMYVMNYYHEYNIMPDMPNEELLHTASAKINSKTNLKRVSLDLGLDYKTVKILNAQFIKGYIPRNDGKYTITLPEQHLYTYADRNQLEIYYHPANVRSISAKKIIKEAPKPIQKKPKQYKIAVAQIKPYNHSNYRKNKVLEYFSSENDHKRRPFKYYSIKRKESLSDIATRENVELSELIELNNINPKNPPKIGDIIRVYIDQKS